MRILSAAIFLFWALYCSGAFAEQLSGSAYASSEGNRHIVSFSGWYGGEQADYEYIFFGRQSVGICTPDEFLYDSRIPFVLEPWNGPGLRLSGTIEFEAPNSGVLYRYQPYAMDYDGNERIILNWLLGSDSHEVTRIEPAPLSVCGPVPVEATSWGGVKSMYR